MAFCEQEVLSGSYSPTLPNLTNGLVWDYDAGPRIGRLGTKAGPTDQTLSGLASKATVDWGNPDYYTEVRTWPNNFQISSSGTAVRIINHNSASTTTSGSGSFSVINQFTPATGDVVVLFVCTAHGDISTAVSGWTRIFSRIVGGQPSLFVYKKTITTTDVADLWIGDPNTAVTWHLLIFRGIADVRYPKGRVSMTPRSGAVVPTEFETDFYDVDDNSVELAFWAVQINSMSGSQQIQTYPSAANHVQNTTTKLCSASLYQGCAFGQSAPPFSASRFNSTITSTWDASAIVTLVRSSPVNFTPGGLTADFRDTDADDRGLLLRLDGAGQEITVSWQLDDQLRATAVGVGGSVLGTSPGNVQAGDLIGAEVAGNQLRLYINRLLVAGPFTIPPAYLAGTRAGLFNEFGDDIRWADFQICQAFAQPTTGWHVGDIAIG